MTCKLEKLRRPLRLLSLIQPRLLTNPIDYPVDGKSEHLTMNCDGGYISCYAIRVRPRHEERMNCLLESRKIVAFPPLYGTRRKWAGPISGVAVAVVSRLRLLPVRRRPAGIGVAYARSYRRSLKAGTTPASIDPRKFNQEF